MFLKSNFHEDIQGRYSQDVPVRVSCAEMEMMRDEERDVLKSYEQVLMLDPNNLQANIFLGNYYYLQVENAKN